MASKNIQKNDDARKNSLMLANIIRLCKYIKAKTRQYMMKRQKLLI